MKTQTCRAAFIAAFLLVVAPDARAQSLALASADMDFLFITPDNLEAEVIISSPWLISVFATATDLSGTDTQSDGGLDDFYSVDALVIDASSGADADSAVFTDPFGGASADAGPIFPAPAIYSASSQATTTLLNTFSVTGGVGAVDVEIGASLYLAIFAGSLGPGYSAGGETLFELFLDGNSVPLLSLTQSLSLANDVDDILFDDDLFETVSLNYGQNYSLYIVIDAQTFATGDGSNPVPEASSVIAMGLGVGLFALSRLGKKARS